MNPLPIKIKKFSELATHCKTMQQSRFVLASHKDIIAMKTALEFMGSPESVFHQLWGKSYAREGLSWSSGIHCRQARDATLDLLLRIAEQAPSWGSIPPDDIDHILSLCRNMRLQQRKMALYEELHKIARSGLYT